MPSVNFDSIHNTIWHLAIDSESFCGGHVPGLKMSSVHSVSWPVGNSVPSIYRHVPIVFLIVQVVVSTKSSGLVVLFVH